MSVQESVTAEAWSEHTFLIPFQLVEDSPYAPEGKWERAMWIEEMMQIIQSKLQTLGFTIYVPEPSRTSPYALHATHPGATSEARIAELTRQAGKAVGYISRSIAV